MSWEPPNPDSQGRYTVGDWRPVRNAIDAAKQQLGEPQAIEQRDWNLVVLALDHMASETRPKCISCKTRLPWHEVIRCLDCKAPLCEHCAPQHFWPNGKPRKTAHK